MTDISVEGLSAKLKQNRLGCIFFLLLQKRLRLQFNGYIKWVQYFYDPCLIPYVSEVQNVDAVDHLC